MSDIMRPMSIGHLMNWALSEYKKKGSTLHKRTGTSYL